MSNNISKVYTIYRNDFVCIMLDFSIFLPTKLPPDVWSWSSSYDITCSLVGNSCAFIYFGVEMGVHRQNIENLEISSAIAWCSVISIGGSLTTSRPLTIASFYINKSSCYMYNMKNLRRSNRCKLFVTCNLWESSNLLKKTTAFCVM